ncbi:MAG: hypothetical protein B5766_10680 [Candidatus Lumbricidophila eiseniae]|uniref:Uncharacterized protein n=1 Tax=Candidatus Lumbricidiphila eiseniae TaxID=1969409 RepID=A0A2A6FQE0_9MICO|nr:MAG: hypothetical protein B5766_10680 [Candidatus Lumbricidophila eiseniae]
MGAAHPSILSEDPHEACSPVFKTEAQRLVLFMFTESRVALLWVHMTVMCREVERVQTEKSADAGWSVRQIAYSGAGKQALSKQGR